MTEEEKALNGELFFPNVKELSDRKAKAHNLSREYNKLDEEEVDKRKAILDELVGSVGEGTSLMGPIFFHYGCHTTIGKDVYINTNFTVQDDCYVNIGDNCRFGPNVTIVTPLHPLDADQRRNRIEEDGTKRFYVHAKPVNIKNDCWICANVTVLPGVTIGENCVIGAGSVVSKDIPANSLAYGVPCRVIRQITEQDKMDF